MSGHIQMTQLVGQSWTMCLLLVASVQPEQQPVHRCTVYDRILPANSWKIILHNDDTTTIIVIAIATINVKKLQFVEF